MKIDVEVLMEKINEEIEQQYSKITGLEWLLNKLSELIASDVIQTTDEQLETKPEDEPKDQTETEVEPETEKSITRDEVKEFFSERDDNNGDTTEEQKNEILDMYDQGHSLDDICNKFGKANTTVMKILKAAGIEPVFDDD